MSCYNGCYSTPTISCGPCPSASTGCLEYIGTDCVQYLGTSNAIGFGILQNDSLTTIIGKISGATGTVDTWEEVVLTASASTYGTYTPMATKNYIGEVKFNGIASGDTDAITNSVVIGVVPSSAYNPLTQKGFIVTYGLYPILVTVATNGTITATDLSASGGATILVDLSQIWYDKNI